MGKSLLSPLVQLQFLAQARNSSLYTLRAKQPVSLLSPASWHILGLNPATGKDIVSHSYFQTTPTTCQPRLMVHLDQHIQRIGKRSFPPFLNLTSSFMSGGGESAQDVRQFKALSLQALTSYLGPAATTHSTNCREKASGSVFPPHCGLIDQGSSPHTASPKPTETTTPHSWCMESINLKDFILPLNSSVEHVLFSSCVSFMGLCYLLSLESHLVLLG